MTVTDAVSPTLDSVTVTGDDSPTLDSLTGREEGDEGGLTEDFKEVAISRRACRVGSLTLEIIGEESLGACRMEMMSSTA